MDYSILIPSETVEFTDLNDMIEQLYRMTGQKAVIKRHFVVETDSPKLKLIFEEFSGLLAGSKPSNGKAAKAPKGTKEPKSPEGTMGRASRRIVATGYVLSLVELKKMMRAGEIDDGTVIENHRGERFVVMGGELIKEPQS